jgi:hypothetical protein
LVLHRALKYVVRWCTLTNQPHIASLAVESITVRGQTRNKGIKLSDDEGF